MGDGLGKGVDMRIPEFWLGDEASFQSLLQSYLMFQDRFPHEIALPKAKVEEDEEGQSLLDLFTGSISAVDGDVGIININGPLVSDADFWALMMGAVPYPAIDRVLEKFSESDEIQSILLNIGTSGGDAVGVDETANKIRLVSRSKPVTAWSGSRALSAGYWLGSAADRLYGTRMAEFGSIGVVTTHTSVSRMLKERGVDVTVVRAGKYKALGHPAEKLSDEGLELLKEKSDKLYGFFVDHVASARGLKTSAKDSWAEGRTFFGDEALSIGLVDGVKSLRDVVQGLNDSRKPKELTMPKQVYLSQEAAAAVASGVSLEQVPHEEVEVDSEAEISAAASEPMAAETVATPAEQVAAVLEPAKSESELVSFLRSELAVERQQVSELKQKLAHIETSLASAQASEDQLLPIVIEATQRMMVGLNQTPMDMAELPASVVATQYSKVKAAFESRFRVGRQSLESKEVHSDVPKGVAARQLGITPKDKGTLGSHPAWA